MIGRSVFLENMVRPEKWRLLKGPRPGEDRKRGIAGLEVQEVDGIANGAELHGKIGMHVWLSRSHRVPDAQLELVQSSEVLGNITDVLDRRRHERSVDLGRELRESGHAVLRASLVAMVME